jgi:hypothetical protein
MWKKEYEKILKEWKARAFINMWLQLNSSYYYNFLNNALTFPVIILSSVSSATIFAVDNQIARYVIATFSIMSVIMTSLMMEFSPDQKKEEHLSTTRQYSKMIKDIDYCLSLPLEMRPEPIQYIDKINNEFDNINENEAIVPKSIIRKFESKFGNLDKILYGEAIVNILLEDINTTRIATRLISREA